MSEPGWTSEPFAVHFGVKLEVAGQLELEAAAAGAQIIRLDLSDIHDRGALSDRFAVTFKYPFKARGLDAAISLISDLEWLGVSEGHLLVVEGLDAAPGIVSDLAGILPAIVNRWRGQHIPFVAVLIGSGHRPLAAAALEAANDRLDRAGQLPWMRDTGSVPIVDHGGGGDPDPNGPI